MKRFVETLALCPVCVAAMAAPAPACSTCFGDPDSAMAKGALMGVYVMVGVVGFVLAGIAGTGLFWMQRSRRLSRMPGQSGVEGE